MPGFIDSLFGKITEMDGKKRLAIGGVVVLVVAAVVTGWMLMLGGEKARVNPLETQMEFDEPSGGVEVEGGGMLYEESVIQRRVQATLEAIPPEDTPVPTETPDVPATFQAEMADRRARADRVLKLHPLDREVVRNPYLNYAEVSYLEDLGGVLWANAKAWMHIRRVLFVEVADWSLPLLEFHVSEGELFLKEGDEYRSRRDYELGEVVEAYGDTIYEGMEGIKEGLERLSEAEDILAESDSGLSSDLSYEDREELGRLKRQAERDLGEFDDAMSRYGCSVCGELFRLKGR